MSNEHNDNDELKRLLRQKLASNQPAEDGWNVPSGGVWSGIADELASAKASKSSKTRKFWPFLVIGSLLAVLMIRECGHFRHVNRLEQEIEKIQHDCEEKQGNAKRLNSDSNSETASLAMGSTPIAVSVEGTEAPVFSKNLAKPIKHSAVFAKDLSTRKLAMHQSAADSSLSVNFFHEQLTHTSLGEPSSEKLAALPISALKTPLGTMPQPRLNLPSNHLDVGLPFSLAASVHAGLSFTGNHLKGQQPSIFAKQKPLWSWNTGLGLEANLNRRWSVLAGINYSVSRFETDYQLQVPFTHVNEYQHDDGNFDNKYNHSLPSSLGSYPAQFVLTRSSDANIHEGDLMDLELHVRQQTQLLGFPLQLRYSMGRHRWQAGVKAGLVANRTLGVASETPTLIPHHDDIHQRHASIGAPVLADLQKWTLDYTLGIDVGYQATTRIGLFLTTAHQRGITPIYEGQNLRNYLYAWHLGTGLKVWLW